MPISFHCLELLLFSFFKVALFYDVKEKLMLLHMTRHFAVLGKPCKRLLTNLRVYLQNITVLLSASSSRQQLTAVVTHFPFHKPQLQYDTQSTPYPFSGLGI